MIYSPGRNYIFIHAPKTGGTSMALALEARAMKDDILCGDTPKATRRRKKRKRFPGGDMLKKHSVLQEVEAVFGRPAVMQAFTFTMVRNPWDRMVSYYQWIKAQQFSHPHVTLAQTLEFGAFLTNEIITHSFARSTYGRMMQRADGVEKCDLFIRLEHLEEDCAPLWQHLGFRLPLPHVNASDRMAEYRHYYTPEQAAHLARICSEDIARFGYTFG